MRRRSVRATWLAVLRVVMILAGIVFAGRWIVESIGGEIRASSLLLAIGFFVGAFAMSYLA